MIDPENERTLSRTTLRRTLIFITKQGPPRSDHGLLLERRGLIYRGHGEDNWGLTEYGQLMLRRLKARTRRAS